jgi:osmotically-inducible protein OsmY
MTRTIRALGGAVLALALGLTPATGAEKRTDRGPTASDQSNDPTDLRLTQEIRKALVDDDSLSTNAHNVKVITNGGVVTLRGPVDDAAEAARVVAVAERVAGGNRVRNELQVSKK